MLRLNILICSYESSIKDIPSILLPQRSDVRYFVSHQHSASWQGDVPALLLDRQDVTLSSFVGKGISQNRNHCLEMLFDSVGGADASLLDNELCVIADDDVRYKQEGIDCIIRSFENHPETDIIFFKIATPDGEAEFKKYSPQARQVKKVVLSGDGYLSSIEMAFRAKAIALSAVSFDEDFGLGSAVHPQGGEETVFLADCLKAGMRAMYLPEYVVIHPFESTGKSKKSIEKADMMLALCKRTVGVFSFETFKAALRCLYRRIIL